MVKKTILINKILTLYIQHNIGKSCNSKKLKDLNNGIILREDPKGT